MGNPQDIPLLRAPNRGPQNSFSSSTCITVRMEEAVGARVPGFSAPKTHGQKGKGIDYHQSGGQNSGDHLDSCDGVLRSVWYLSESSSAPKSLLSLNIKPEFSRTLFLPPIVSNQHESLTRRRRPQQRSRCRYAPSQFSQGTVLDKYSHISLRRRTHSLTPQDGLRSVPRNPAVS